MTDFDDLSTDRAGLRHEHEDHPTLTGEIRCTICNRPAVTPTRTN